MAAIPGDMRNSVAKLLREVQRMKLKVEPDIQSLCVGSPAGSLPLLHSALMHYSLPLANWLTRNDFALSGKNDLRFLEALYKVLRDVFHYRPRLTREQFLSCGFAERKVQLTTEVLLLCQAKHRELSASTRKTRKAVNVAPPTGGLSICAEPHPLTVQDEGICTPPLSHDQFSHALFTSSPSRELDLTPQPPKHSASRPSDCCHHRTTVVRHLAEHSSRTDTAQAERDHLDSPESSWLSLPQEPAEDDIAGTRAAEQEQLWLSEQALRELSARVQQLTVLVETMSARSILLETQVKLLEAQSVRTVAVESRGVQTETLCGRADKGTQTEGRGASDRIMKGTSSGAPPKSGVSFGGVAETPVKWRCSLREKLLISAQKGWSQDPASPSSPHTPEDTRTMIEQLRGRAKMTKDFLHLANSTTEGKEHLMKN